MKSFQKSINKIKHKVLPQIPQQSYSTSNQFKSEMCWLNLQYHNKKKTIIKKPHELENEMSEPPDSIDKKLYDKIAGSMIGLTLGDALGAHVEFRPHKYLVENPVKNLEGGGTWGLKKGQFTDDTSMTLCLASSLIVTKDFNLYDQLVRYKWWYRNGYMSSTGECFDIGKATSDSLNTFESRQNDFAEQYGISVDQMDSLSDKRLLEKFDVFCSKSDAAGNGALMRLAPVPLFFYRSPKDAVKYSGLSAKITHGDKRAYDACRYYGALIVAALHGYTKDQLLDKQFYIKHKQWFNDEPLCNEIKLIAEGSYQRKGGYADGIEGKGFVISALESALWAFWSEDSFKEGALAAVNLGNDTDTTAAIYGQLAGAYYGYTKLPQSWIKHIYAKGFILNLSKWLTWNAQIKKDTEISSPVVAYSPPAKAPVKETNEKFLKQKSNSTKHILQLEYRRDGFKSIDLDDKPTTEMNHNRTKLRATASTGSQKVPLTLELASLEKRYSDHNDIDLYSNGKDNDQFPKKIRHSQLFDQQGVIYSSPLYQPKEMSFANNTIQTAVRHTNVYSNSNKASDSVFIHGNSSYHMPLDNRINIRNMKNNVSNQQSSREATNQNLNGNSERKKRSNQF